MIRVKINGLDDAISRFEHMPEALTRGLNRGMGQAVQNTVGQAKLNASGRPGPRVVNGRLRSSIAGRVENNGRRGVVGSKVKYAPYLELGTSRMRPYPYLKPAIVSPFRQMVISELIKRGVLAEVTRDS